MPTNLDRYKNDVERLCREGDILRSALLVECFPEKLTEQLKKSEGKPKLHEFWKNLPEFDSSYQAWYSEALAVIRQLLPDRVADFVRHYERPKNRKEINVDSYRIEDCLNGLQAISRATNEVLVGRQTAISLLDQQIAILKAVHRRFESSLFEIRQLVQADLFDSELSAAEELMKNRFLRAAGAMAGVVLERHLGQVCRDHNFKVGKKAPSISDFNEALKGNSVIEVADWRFVQHLGDLRNLCDHNKNVEPTKEQVADLIAGVKKILKTIA